MGKNSKCSFRQSLLQVTYFVFKDYSTTFLLMLLPSYNKWGNCGAPFHQMQKNPVALGKALKVCDQSPIRTNMKKNMRSETKTLIKT